MNYYTGVGSRKAPENILNEMKEIAEVLENSDFILRTGDAYGSDEAFRSGIVNEENVVVYDRDTINFVDENKWNKAVDLVLSLHPFPIYARRYTSILGRNAFQVLGDNLDDPSLFLICWTESGVDSGGTGTTIRVANVYNVPVFNLFNLKKKTVLDKIQGMIEWELEI